MANSSCATSPTAASTARRAGPRRSSAPTGASSLSPCSRRGSRLDKAKKDKKKGDDAPKAGAAWMDLSTGKVEIVDRVKRFAWGKDGGQHLALLLEAPAKKEGSKDAKAAPAKVDAEMDDGIDAGIDADLDANPRDQEAPAEGGAPSAKKVPGNDLLLIDAGTKQRNTFKDASDFAWNNGGTLLAYVVSVKEPAKKDASKPSAPAVPAVPAVPAASASSAPGVPGASTVSDVPPAVVAEARPAPDDTAREGVYLIDPAAPTQARAVMSGAGSYKRRASTRPAAAWRSSAAAITSPRPRPRRRRSGPTTRRRRRREEGREGRQARSHAVQALPVEGRPGARRGAGQRADRRHARRLDTGEHAALAFSKDGQRLFLGTAELPRPSPRMRRSR